MELWTINKRCSDTVFWQLLIGREMTGSQRIGVHAGHADWNPLWTATRTQHSREQHIRPVLFCFYTSTGLTKLKIKIQWCRVTWWIFQVEGKWSCAWLDGISDSMDLSLSKLQEIVKNREASHAAVHEVTDSQIRLSD